MKVWRISDVVYEEYSGWKLYQEHTKTYGLTTGLEDGRIRAIKDSEEIIVILNKYNKKVKNMHKLRLYIKEQIDTLEEYRAWICNG